MKLRLEKIFGERCEIRRDDCPICVAYRMADEIESLRRDKKNLQTKVSHLKKTKEKFNFVCEENRKIAKLVTGTLPQRSEAR